MTTVAELTPRASRSSSAPTPTTCSTTRARPIPADQLHLPGPDFVDRVWLDSDRTTGTLRNLQWLFDSGRLAGTGYVSHPAGRPGHRALRRAPASRPNPIYFDPENIVRLAIEGGCNAVASTVGVLGAVLAQVRPQAPVHRQAQPQRAADATRTQFDQIEFASVQRAWDMGAAGVGATIYFGSDQSHAPDRRDRRGLRGGPPARDVHRPVVLPAQLGLQGRRRRLPPRRRPHGPGQPPRRDDPGRHHQAEAAGEQRRLQRRSTRTGVVRQDATSSSTPS